MHCVFNAFCLTCAMQMRTCGFLFAKMAFHLIVKKECENGKVNIYDKVSFNDGIFNLIGALQ